MTQQTGSRAVASMMDAIIQKEADYGASIRENHSRSKMAAHNLAKDGRLETLLMQLTKENSPVLTEEAVTAFLKEQRARLVGLATHNVSNSKTVQSFVAAAKQIRQQELTNTQTQPQEGQDFVDYEPLFRQAMDKDQADKASSQLALEQEKYYREIVENLGEQQTATMDEDEDIMLVNDGSGQAHNLKCPITMVLLKNPVCNKVCKHHYSKDAILDYIATKTRNRGQVSCPVAGCSNRAVTAAQLEDDAEISLHVRRFQRQEQQQSTQRTSQAEDLMDSEEE